MRGFTRQSAASAQTSRTTITRRALLLGVAQTAIVATLGLRMRHMQLEQADEYRLLAEGNSVKIRLIPPARGLIYDRNGVLLAGNEPNYRVTLTREDTEDAAAELASLRRLIALSDAEATALLAEIDSRPPTTPVTISDRLSWEEFSRIAVNAPALPGVTPEVGLSRAYPRGADFAHAIGYVGPVSDYDLGKIENPDPLLRIPRFQLGKTGIEARLEEELRGKAGQRRVEVNVRGREMRELSRRPGEPGVALQLTLEAQLQNFALARLGSESAATVVMDVENGDILAIASAPSFDPNLFVRGISSAAYSALMENDHRPLADKSVQGLYPPGSTFKMVTLLAALEAGVVGPEETIHCPGYHEIGGRRFNCWKRSGHGRVNGWQSLEQSCDVYYYQVSQRVGIEAISDMARRLGIGIRHDLPMSAVAEGNAPTKAWKQARYGKEWLVGDTINASIGQGFVLASPLQLAVMAARIASGRAVVPRLVRGRDGVEAPAPLPPPLALDPANLALARRGMWAVVNGNRGTAAGSKVAMAEWTMAGKTGTSQVRSAVVDNKTVPWEQRDHALFVCYAPYEAPKYAVSLVVEHGGGGSAAAAPIARDILLFALNGGLPPLEAYPASQRGTIKSRFEALDLADPETITAPARGRA